MATGPSRSAALGLASQLNWPGPSFQCKTHLPFLSSQGTKLNFSDNIPIFGKCQKKSWYQYIFFEKGDWTAACPLSSEATRASHTPDEIDEDAFVVVLQVGQLVGEVGEVVAHASLQVLANMTIDRGQRAAAALTYIR